MCVRRNGGYFSESSGLTGGGGSAGIDYLFSPIMDEHTKDVQKKHVGVGCDFSS